MNKRNEYQIELKINKDEVLKDIRQIKKETEKIIKDCEFNVNKLRLKRRDILVIKVKATISPEATDVIAKQLKKKLRRNVLIIDERMDISNIISYKK